MELKLIDEARRKAVAIGLNRTFMELKLVAAARSALKGLGLNRTFMELKQWGQ